MVTDNSLDSLRASLGFDSRDWSLTATDAWIYGVVMGWDEDSLEMLGERWRWTSEKIEVLKDLHEDFMQRKGIDTMVLLELEQEEGGE